MKNRSLLFSILILSLLFITLACEKTNVVLIRIENSTGHDITAVFVSGPEDTHEYGNVNKGGKSDYQVYQSAYRYAFCTFKIGDSEFTIQPIDFVGESLLKNGEYTYRLTISDLDTPWAGMELVE